MGGREEAGRREEGRGREKGEKDGVGLNMASLVKC
jgi:hypothetical protein